MKRLFAMLLCCALLACPVCGQALTADEPLTGVICWPDGADEGSAAYVYRYEYPSFLNDSSAAEAINVHFSYLIDDAMAFAIPMTVAGLDPAADRAVAEIRTEIRCLTDDYLSVLVTTTHTTNGAVRTVYAGHTFTLQGDMAGSATNLPRILGILSDSETDEWLLVRQTEKADSVVRSMVWREIEAMRRSGDIPLYDDLTEDVLAYSFYPEEDFFLDENGEPVFFLQPGVIADESCGMITFPLSISAIDDEL